MRITLYWDFLQFAMCFFQKEIQNHLSSPDGEKQLDSPLLIYCIHSRCHPWNPPVSKLFFHHYNILVTCKPLTPRTKGTPILLYPQTRLPTPTLEVFTAHSRTLQWVERSTVCTQAINYCWRLRPLFHTMWSMWDCQAMLFWRQKRPLLFSSHTSHGGSTFCASWTWLHPT